MTGAVPGSAVAADAEPLISSEHFRSVLGTFPTGVVVVTAVDDAGAPVGMTVGSFTSVSLSPPLVAFLPAKASTTFPAIRAAGSFCVNVLAADQVDLCRSFAVKGADKFQGVSWSPTGSGAPAIENSLAWIDCDIESIAEAGDHYMVTGRVRALDVAREGEPPMVFYRGGYGQFHVPSLTAGGDLELLEPIRTVDRCRPTMEALSTELGGECLALTMVRNALVIVGSAGVPRRGDFTTRIGQRVPAVPPMGAAFVAWGSDQERADWWGPTASPTAVVEAEALLDRVRERGWSLALRSREQMRLEAAVGVVAPDEPDAEALAELADAVRLLPVGTYEPERVEPDELYDVRTITCPVFAASGRVVLTLALFDLPSACPGAQVLEICERLRAACDALTDSLSAG
ncbi:MAG: flavin reductase [Nocardioidaceae bacterium]